MSTYIPDDLSGGDFTLGSPLIDNRNSPIVAGATIGLTGGTGSFGATMARHLLDSGVSAVHVLSRDETKQHEMRLAFDDMRLRTFLGDVREAPSVATAVEGADFVFHAAALKHVPTCELFPDQAIATNVAGSANVIRAAHEAGVRVVVCLSTDQAVYPINAMGLSKALMEKSMHAFTRQHPHSNTVVTTVRFGHILDSRGSLVPLFVEQIRADRPMTISDPAMTRFLMSQADAVELVEHAFASAHPGDVFVRKTPAATVQTLAQAVAQLMGVPQHPIQVAGIRHGEKMHEVLVSSEEMALAEDEGHFVRIPLDARGLDYQLYNGPGHPPSHPRALYTSQDARQLSLDETVHLLRSAVAARQRR